MCLAVPARIVSMDDKMATVEVGGLTRQASVVLLPDAGIGDYVLIHAGFAISLVDEQEALETLRLFRELAGGGAEDPGGAGDTGAACDDGAAGDDAYTWGAMGDTGATGDEGSTGESGATGDATDSGDTGAMGLQD